MSLDFACCSCIYIPSVDVLLVPTAQDIQVRWTGDSKFPIGKGHVYLFSSMDWKESNVYENKMKKKNHPYTKQTKTLDVVYIDQDI